MTEPLTTTSPAEGSKPAPPGPGAMLRAAREAAGLSLDAVAQQLKLAPRQVVALENGDYEQLPGRTFVRGFLRNYARLVHVDADVVLAALSSGTAAAPPAPSLHATAPTMGELPAADHARPAWARWSIPVTLVAVIATAAIYEFTRGGSDLRRNTPAAPVTSPAPPPAASEAERPQPKANESETPLANPLAGPAGSAPGPAGSAATPAVPATGSGAGSAVPATGLPPGPAASSPSASGRDVAVVLSFRDSSWTEVRDATGRVLLSQMIPGGQSRTLSGTPPLELVIGNAGEASLIYRGQPVDLAPYTRQNVARVVLQ